ncbi:hypothetical protein Aph01nite_01290 [Acrocarpospora phusangensis]|uniref:Uncharacterized protein n=1 Tax=Acrocarpospora phusangensis TaxID=1070424 RepID=A0A919Q5W8_9ACTN|nr:hypothetical protein [Acrocarpospora phusangensis]GIH21819.1 hypothetical protein Aph01nite_01290 [Acrocarpospora phusangensis]
MAFKSGSFQIPFGLAPALLSGNIQAEFVDVGGGPPADVLKAGDAFQVNFSWEITGSLAPMIGGTWQLRLLIDEIGGPHDAPFPATPQLKPLTGVNAYTDNIIVTNGLPAGPGGSSYALVASLSYLNVAGTPGAMGGFVDLGLISVVA